ncbi:MAG: transcriptional regulator, BadM/Rrf2 family [Firmicutes bacterium]|nr:transcriptional regulator, BadM/Rrf2 family [Bacillota bacterium]
MKVSTKSRYGVAAMVDIAQQYGAGPVALRSVAERQQVSEHYLEQLMSNLRNAGFVRSIRGAQGGYVLARDPAAITVGDIVRAMEGPIAPVDCLLADVGKNNPYCNKSQDCIRRNIWLKMGESISEALDSISLASLCADAQRVNEEKERGEQKS